LYRIIDMWICLYRDYILH